MKYKTVTIGVKRDVRHARYIVSQCSAQLTAELEPGDDLEEVYREVHDDVVFIVEAAVEEEKRKYKEEMKSAIKNQQGQF